MADALREQRGDLDQRLVAGTMPERVVDHLQAVEVDEQHRSVDSVAVDSRDQPLELAHEAAPIRQVDQRILVRQLVELLHALLQTRDFPSQQADLFDQPITVIDVDDVSQLVRHCPEPSLLSVSPSIA